MPSLWVKNLGLGVMGERLNPSCLETWRSKTCNIAIPLEMCSASLHWRWNAIHLGKYRGIIDPRQVLFVTGGL